MRPSARARIGLIAALACAACGPPAGRTTPDPERERELSEITRAEPQGAEPALEAAGRALTPSEARAFGPLLDAAERIRGLRFVRPVPTRVQSQGDIVAFVRGHIDREELEQARVFYVALGLLAPDLDVERMILAVLGEQIVGYYDPDDGVMVVREDVVADLARSSDLAHDQSAIVLVHEYVHALQDQHLDLHEQQDVERTIDGENAFASLVEGDATLAMIGWIVESQGARLSQLTRDPRVLAGVVRDQPMAGGEELGSAPAIVRAPLLSRYLDGLLFCADLHGRGGFRWIDETFARPPESTEQVLHPDRYLARERPETIPLPPFPELETAGYAVHDEDTLGELETSVYFAQGTDHDRELAAASGWGGDTLRIYTREGASSAVVWWTSWDDEREAIEAEAAAGRVRDLASTPASHLVRRTGRGLLIVRDLDPALHAAVIDDFDPWARALPAHPRQIVD